MRNCASERPRRAIRPSQLSVFASVILVGLSTTGFMHAPHARWARGKITAIDPAQAVLTLETIPAHKTMTFHWDSKTRFWQDPVKRNERGAEFQATNVQVGAAVRVMFKRVARTNLAARILADAPANRAADNSK